MSPHPTSHPTPQGEARFLTPRASLWSDIGMLIRIGAEFWRGAWSLRGMGPAITVFGSARFGEGHPAYEKARQIGRLAAEAGFAVMTGGGPGVMEAANRGAKEAAIQAKESSIGCNIILPHEQGHNAYLDRVVTFYYFFVRKVMLVKYSSAFIIMPGGMGTLDEMSEAITLIQTGKLHHFPVILVGTEYWRGFREWLENTLVPQGAVTASDLQFMHFTDDPQDVLKIVNQTMERLDYETRHLSPQKGPGEK